MTPPTITEIKTQLEDILRLADDATPGPWEASDNVVACAASDGYYMVTCDSRRTTMKADANNANFIARARTMTPAACRALLTVIEALEPVSKRMECMSGAFQLCPTPEAHKAMAILESIRNNWPTTP